MTGNHSHHIVAAHNGLVQFLAARCGKHFAVIQGNFGVAIVTLGNGDDVIYIDQTVVHHDKSGHILTSFLTFTA